MANHLGRMAQAQQIQQALPVLRWATIAKSGDLYHLALMETQGNRILSQKLEKGDAHRPYVEAQFQTWTALNILDREENP